MLDVVPHPDGWAIVDPDGHPCGVTLTLADALWLAEQMDHETSPQRRRRL